MAEPLPVCGPEEPRAEQRHRAAGTTFLPSCYPRLLPTGGVDVGAVTLPLLHVHTPPVPVHCARSRLARLANGGEFGHHYDSSLENALLRSPSLTTRIIRVRVGNLCVLCSLCVLLPLAERKRQGGHDAAAHRLLRGPQRRRRAAPRIRRRHCMASSSSSSLTHTTHSANTCYEILSALLQRTKFTTSLHFVFDALWSTTVRPFSAFQARLLTLLCTAFRLFYLLATKFRAAYRFHSLVDDS